MRVNEVPVERCPGLLPVTCFIVTHLFNVVGSTNVRLGGKATAVSKLAHTVDIGHHHPVVGIDVHAHEPAIHIVWVNLTQQHYVTHHHQSFDVVVVAVLQGVIDGMINRRQTSGTVPIGGRQRPGVLKKVLLPHLVAVHLVTRADKFTPPQDLPDEPFQAVHWYVVFVGVGNGFVQYVLRCEESNIQQGRNG